MFFNGAASLPQQTPKALLPLRQKELASLQASGQAGWWAKALELHDSWLSTHACLQGSPQRGRVLALR